MIIMGIVLLYLIGCLVAYMGTLGYFYYTFLSLNEVDASIKTYPILWKMDFEVEWKSVEDERKKTSFFALMIMFGSWMGVFIWLMSGGYKRPFMFRVPPMPAKEKVRLIVDEMKKSYEKDY